MNNVYKDKNPNIASKIIYDQFNTDNFYYGTDKNAFQIPFNPKDASVTSIRDAYDQARLLMCLLNAKEVDYHYEAILTEIVPANVVLEGAVIVTLVSLTGVYDSIATDVDEK